VIDGVFVLGDSAVQSASAEVITMLILPLDATEPFAATLGIMLYPGAGEVAKARSFAANYLAGPLRDFHAAGYTLPYDRLLSIAAPTRCF
jgi:hypothetical protein